MKVCLELLRVIRSMFYRSLLVFFLLAIVLSVLRFTDSNYPFGIFDMQNPTQYLALFNLQKYIQNNLQVLNNVNNFKAKDLPHRIYMTLTDLALLLFFLNFIGRIIKTNYVIVFCFTETKEESPEYSDMLIISISAGVLLFAIIGMGCLAKYGKLKKVLCCSVSWRGEERTLVRHVAEIVNQLIQQSKWGTSNDAGPEESHEMMSP